MSDFIFEIDEEASASASTGAGGKFGTLDTGIYDAVITSASLGKTKAGNNVMDLSIKCDDGHELTIYQAFVMDKKWASGADNFGYNTWQAFITTTQMKGMTKFQKPLLKEDGTPVMKNGQPVVLNAIKELEGAKIKLALVKVLDYHKNEVQETNEVFATFNADGASSKEILSGSQAGQVLEKLAPRLADKHEKAYKAFIANGGETEDNGVDDSSVATEDLGL